MTVRAPLGPLLRAFFADHLLQQKAVSPQTIHAYRDAFRLLLTFLKQHRQRKPEVLTLDDLDAPVIHPIAQNSFAPDAAFLLGVPGSESRSAFPPWV